MHCLFMAKLDRYILPKKSLRIHRAQSQKSSLKWEHGYNNLYPYTPPVLKFGQNLNFSFTLSITEGAREVSGPAKGSEGNLKRGGC